VERVLSGGSARISPIDVVAPLFTPIDAMYFRQQGRVTSNYGHCIHNVMAAVKATLLPWTVIWKS
jgi:hypothetical protein